jgi:hypothetical protein
MLSACCTSSYLIEMMIRQCRLDGRAWVRMTASGKCAAAASLFFIQRKTEPAPNRKERRADLILSRVAGALRQKDNTADGSDEKSPLPP